MALFWKTTSLCELGVCSGTYWGLPGINAGRSAKPERENKTCYSLVWRDIPSSAYSCRTNPDCWRAVWCLQRGAWMTHASRLAWQQVGSLAHLQLAVQNRAGSAARRQHVESRHSSTSWMRKN